MKSIGGYFNLELRNGREYHEGAIALNTGRNAFEYIIIANGYKKVYLPYYTCEVMLQPIVRQGIEYEFYRIDEGFRPLIEEKNISSDSVLVYNNYFGLHDREARLISEHYKNIIIDNSQAFYALPLTGIDTFYSPRKFFGVPDGGYLYSNKQPEMNLERDFSVDRMGHLLVRIDQSAEEGFRIFKKNEESLSGSEIKLMSSLTRQLLRNIDYERCGEVRRENIKILHRALGAMNCIKIELEHNSIPMIYPFLTDKKGLKEYLISKKIYCATYWESVKRHIDDKSWEYRLATDLVALPVDQRYNLEDMQKMVTLILRYV